MFSLFGDGAEDALAAQRQRVMLPVSVVAVACFLPFTINNFVQRHYVLGAVTLGLMVVFATNAAAIFLKRPPPIPSWSVLLFMVPAVTISLRVQGVYGAFWCYPVVLYFYFALRRKAATLCTAALIAAATVMVYRYVDGGTAARVFTSLLLTTIVLNIFLGVIGDLQGRLLQQSIKDPLTGVFNRRHMDECLQDAIERRTRTGAPSSLLALDLDHFKSINDRFGHAAGDRVLQKVVALMTSRRRRLDLLFRAGGEEFVLLLPDTRGGQALVVAENLRSAVAQALRHDAQRVSVSIGVAELKPEESAATWLDRADRCLYEAKRTGRNRVVGAGPAEVA